jgi:hypothetical protein
MDGKVGYEFVQNLIAYGMGFSVWFQSGEECSDHW